MARRKGKKAPAPKSRAVRGAAVGIGRPIKKGLPSSAPSMTGFWTPTVRRLRKFKK